MTYAGVLSSHPLATHAVGESVGELLERVGPEPDLVVLFASADHTGAIDDIASAVRTLLRPRVLVGCTASTVIGGEREIEDATALSLWAASDVDARVHPLPGPVPGGAPLLVVGDPYSLDVDDVLRHPHVFGGFASAARGPGGNRIVVDGVVRTAGGVAVSLHGVEVETVVSQGCRPIGDPFIVTRAEGSLVHELGGQSAMQRVQEILAALTPEDIGRARHGLHIGRVVDESKPTFGPGDFVIRNVLGGDRATGSIAIGDDVEVGSTLQLQVRDAGSADEELRTMMAGRDAAGALLFTCNGRGTSLFVSPHHDAAVVDEALGGHAAIAGMSCAGELGPVGGRSFLHGFTASVALFGDRTR